MKYHSPHVIEIPKGVFEAQQSRESAIEYFVKNGRCPCCFCYYIPPADPYIHTDNPTYKIAKEHIESHDL